MRNARYTICIDEHYKQARSAGEDEYPHSYLLDIECDLESLVDDINRTDSAIPSNSFCPIVREVCEYINALREENSRLIKAVGEKRNA